MDEVITTTLHLTLSHLEKKDSYVGIDTYLDLDKRSSSLDFLTLARSGVSILFSHHLLRVTGEC